MFTLPQSGEADGSSNEHPLKLEGLSVDDFRAFVSATVPRYVAFKFIISPKRYALNKSDAHSMIPGGKACLMSLPEWARVLHLADMWQIDDLRTEAIEEMSTKFNEPAAVLQLLLADRYSIQDWIRPAVSHLTLRQTTLTVQEIEELGLELAVKVLHIRDTNLRAHVRATAIGIASAANTEIAKMFKNQVAEEPAETSESYDTDYD
jgi:hypothetical protein